MPAAQNGGLIAAGVSGASWPARVAGGAPEGDGQMKRMLIAYATNAGSTAEVAAAVGEELGKAGVQVEVRQIDETTPIEGYDAVVVGAP